MISIFGCADVVVTKKYLHKFGIGSIVYVRRRAAVQGKLEAVAIKKVSRVTFVSDTAGNTSVFRYKDTLNGLWDEEDLVWQAEAVDLATAYWQRIKSEADQIIKKGCFSQPDGSC